MGEFRKAIHDLHGRRPTLDCVARRYSGRTHHQLAKNVCLSMRSCTSTDMQNSCDGERPLHLRLIVQEPQSGACRPISSTFVRRGFHVCKGKGPTDYEERHAGDGKVPLTPAESAQPLRPQRVAQNRELRLRCARLRASVSLN
jgi:hypothetical protein